jgi:hypothetical protein
MASWYIARTISLFNIRAYSIHEMESVRVDTFLVKVLGGS